MNNDKKCDKCVHLHDWIEPYMNAEIGKRSIEIRASYSFWRHPIKWWKQRKIRKLLQLWLNVKYPHLAEDAVEMQMDMLFYGTAIMKDGRRVDPKTFSQELTDK